MFMLSPLFWLPANYNRLLNWARSSTMAHTIYNSKRLSYVIRTNLENRPEHHLHVSHIKAELPLIKNKEILSSSVCSEGVVSVGFRDFKLCTVLWVTTPKSSSPSLRPRHDRVVAQDWFRFGIWESYKYSTECCWTTDYDDDYVPLVSFCELFKRCWSGVERGVGVSSWRAEWPKTTDLIWIRWVMSGCYVIGQQRCSIIVDEFW